MCAAALYRQLKANRIEDGIANYDAVLQLMLGTTLGGRWTPK